MNHFAIIDTETTWSGALMTLGILIVDSDSFEIKDNKYIVIKEALLEGGMFEYAVHIRGLKEEKVSLKNFDKTITDFLSKKQISSIYAYNAGFDKRCLPCLNTYIWHDIMSLAAYKQYNPAITDEIKCCSTGRLKSGYGVEGIMRLFGKTEYIETHNALLDAMDELEIMKLLGHKVDHYPRLK